MSKLNRQQQAAPTGSKIIDWLRIIDHVARRGATEKEIEILGEAMLIARKYMENPVEDQNVFTYRRDYIRPEQIIFDTQRDAEKVHNTLIKLAEEYGSVSVADYYDICALSPQYICGGTRYGWCAKEIQNSAIHCISMEYTIDLPAPILLPCPRKRS